MRTLLLFLALLGHATATAEVSKQEIRRNVERIGTNWTVKPIQPSRAFLEAAKFTVSKLRDPKFFEAPSGWIGVVGVDNKGKTIALYLDPEARYVMAGMVVDTLNGMELSRAAIMQFAPSSDLAAVARAEIESTKNTAAKALGVPRMPTTVISANELARADFIQTGQTGKLVYVFFDPFDPSMRDAWNSLRPQVQAGKLIVRWIPVARTGEASFGMSAGILGSKQPVDALLRQLEGTGFRPADSQISSGAQSASNNTRLVNRLKAPGLPVWALTEGNAIRTATGAKGYEDL